MKKTHVVGLSLLLIAVAAITLPVLAHDWGCWVQPNRTVSTYNSASYWSEANAALNEWQNDTIISVPRTSSHTEVSVFDGNYGNTGWGGLASIESYSGCNITHCHAKVNYYYSYTSNGKRGVFCQEFGHCLGLQHSNDGGCMGGGYYYDINSNYNVVSHNISDINAKYQYKHGEEDGGHGEPGEGPIVHATWFEHPTTLKEARKLASSIVLARVTGIYDAADIVVKVDALEGGEDRIPNQRVQMEVRRVIDGKMSEQTFELFHTGNENFILAGDPPYEIGSSYVLFLTPREDGTYRVISPEGRYDIHQGQLKANSFESFSEMLQGLTVQDIVRDMNEIRRLEMIK